MNKKQNDPEINKSNQFYLIIGLVGLVAITLLYIFRLGSIMHGITNGEYAIAKLPVGWHGIYANPLNLPLTFLRSIDFKIFSPVSIALLRLPNVIIGLVTVILFSILTSLWYGRRIATVTTILFATSAWTLHASRIAGGGVDYLFAITLFFLIAAVLNKNPKNSCTYAATNIAWGILLFIPGMIWFILFDLWRKRKILKHGFKLQTKKTAIAAYAFSLIFWIPLLIIDFVRSPDNILNWLGIPTSLHHPITIIKNFLAVFEQVLFRGPNINTIWLARAPLLDVFSLVMLVIGIYFYIRHFKASRSQLLFGSFIIGALLIALNRSIDLSIVLPILYIWIAAGIAYFLQQWLQVFPKNPIARGLGYSLIIIAVTLACVYNLRAYYVAWPNTTASQSVFDVRL
jgi:hypothetical protein